jgi:hypothetical protein
MSRTTLALALVLKRGHAGATIIRSLSGETPPVYGDRLRLRDWLARCGRRCDRSG